MPEYPPGWVVDTVDEIWVPNEDGDSGRLAYLNDRFLTPEEFPITSPRVCEPGPGQLELFDGDNSEFSISCDGKLEVRGPDTAGWNRQYFHSESPFSRMEGLTVAFKILSQKDLTICMLGWSEIKTESIYIGIGSRFYIQHSNIYSFTVNGINLIGEFNFNNVYEVAIQLRPLGDILLIKGDQYEDWTILWIGSIGNELIVYPHFWTNTFSGYVDNFEVALYDPIQPIMHDDFNRADNSEIGEACNGPNWILTGTWSIINKRLVGSAVNESIALIDTGVTDCFIRCITQAPAGTQGIIVRQTDYANYVKVEYTIDGGFVITEVVDNVPTILNTIGTLPAVPPDTDFELNIALDGPNIRAHFGTDTVITGIIATNLTGTLAGMIKDTTQNVQFDNFYVWPRTLESL